MEYLTLDNWFLLGAVIFSVLVIAGSMFKNHEACKPEKKRKLRSAWFME